MREGSKRSLVAVKAAVAVMGGLMAVAMIAALTASMKVSWRDRGDWRPGYIHNFGGFCTWGCKLVDFLSRLMVTLMSVADI